MSQKKLDEVNYPIKKPPSSTLHQAELSMLASIIKSLPGCIYWKDKAGKYLGCNNNVLELVGMPSVIGKTDFDLPWAELAQPIRDNDLKVLALDSVLEIEETIITANEQELVVLTRKTPLHDDKGNVIGVLGISLNITQRKQQESILKSTQEKTQATLENIVAHMPGHVYWKDTEGVYLGCNNRQARSLGFLYGYEIIGKTDFDLPWGKNKAELFRKNDQHIMANGKTEIIEEKSQVDGKNAVVLSHKSPMYNKNNEIIGVLGISIDISERKKLEAELIIAKEQAETASLAKTEFLENMRHDIRTPLTGIVGFSEIIKSESKDARIKEYADNLVASSHALLHFMDNVLEAIHVSSGEIPRVKKKFILKNILEHAINLNKAKAATKRLDLSLNFDENIPRYIIGDSIRLHRVILELLANALNFTDSGFVYLTATLAKKENREIVVKFLIEDSGMGIPKDKQKEIFLQFKRLSPSYKGIYKGAGLGLAVIKQFIDELDGEIYVSSHPKGGTTFTCIIPLQTSLLDDDSGIDELTEAETMPSVNFTAISNNIEVINAESNTYKYRILVVEDNAIAQLVAKTLLTKFHCHVDVAINGKNGIALWMQQTYDLILMDIGMPDMDGYQVTHHIRSQEAAKKLYTPIIALTAHVGEENKQRCIKAGIDAVISKPLTQQNCSDILSSIILSEKRGNYS